MENSQDIYAVLPEGDKLVEISNQNFRPAVLVVDDDESTRDVLDSVLHEKYNVVKASTAEKGLEILKKTHINVMLLDLKLPGMSGIDMLEEISDKSYDLDVVVITVMKNVESAVKSMKYGVYDYITKDFNIKDVSRIIEKILKKQSEEKEIIYLKSEINQYTDMGFIVGQTPQMHDVCQLIKKVANIPVTVLIQGESGTGKELVARSVHKASGKEGTPFIAVNIASVPDGLLESFLFGHEKGAFTGALKQHFGKFELAHNGTLFLDEIGELKYDLQAKLLRVIQEGEFERVGGTQPIKVNVKLTVATNRDLEKMVSRGTFREDLYYRLNIVPINLPPLRERKSDISALVDSFVNKYNKRFNKHIKGIAESALTVLENYHWPGNIRELENLIERFVAVLDKDIISQPDIPVEYHLTEMRPEYGDEIHYNSDYLRKACETFERNFILRVMEKCQWKKKEAAKKLGIPVSTLKYKLHKQDLTKILKKKKR